MQKQYLFIQNSETDDSGDQNEPISESVLYSDKESLIKIINALMDNNQALRRYIEILEKYNYTNSYH
jgi:hypothetical protein